MIKGKQVFAKEVDGIFFRDPIKYRIYAANKALLEQRIREEQERQERIRKIEDEIKEIREEITKVLVEKKQHDIQMDAYISRACMDAQQKSDAYHVQITKLLQAKEICDKVVLVAKREAAKEFRTKNPFTKLKPLQNRLYRLEIKRDRA